MSCGPAARCPADSSTHPPSETLSHTDLPRLRTLEIWLAFNLDRVRQQIAAAEKLEAERQRGVDARPPAPDWLIERGIGEGPAVYVHVGGCHMAGKRSKGVAREQALRALTDGVEACPHCRPDTELGVLD
ncbi:DUF6233 domain-containing protein [Streptomyces sp. R21]|uniref:DUF6233 domain-containing protein n=1 Tax=Streptomyces sp. R21 TaxID=3238627 RepID=A0AB39P055_9ACTN